MIDNMASKILYIANIPGFEYDSQGPLWVDEIVLTSKTSAMLHLSDTDSGFNTLTFLKWDNDLLSNNQYSATEEKVDDPKTKEQYSFTLAESKLIRIKSNGSANYFLDYLKTDDSSEETLRQLPGKVIHHYLTWTSHLPDGYPKNFDDYEHRGLCYFKTTDRKERFVVNCKMYSSFNGKKILLQDKDVTYDFTGSTIDTGNMEFQHPNPIPQYYDINLGGNADVHIEMPNPNEEENNCLIPVAKYNGGGYIKLEYDTDDKFYNHSEDDPNKYTITSENSLLCIIPLWFRNSNGVFIAPPQFNLLTCINYDSDLYLIPTMIPPAQDGSMWTHWTQQKRDYDNKQIAWDKYTELENCLTATGLLNHGLLLPNLLLIRNKDNIEHLLNNILNKETRIATEWIYHIDGVFGSELKKEKKLVYKLWLEPYVMKSKWISTEPENHHNEDLKNGCFGTLFKFEDDGKYLGDHEAPLYSHWLTLEDYKYGGTSYNTNYQLFLYYLLKDLYPGLVIFFKNQKGDKLTLSSTYKYTLTKKNYTNTNYLFTDAPSVKIKNISIVPNKLINLIHQNFLFIESITGTITQICNKKSLDFVKVEKKAGIHKIDTNHQILMLDCNGEVDIKLDQDGDANVFLTNFDFVIKYHTNLIPKRGGLVAFLPNSLLVALPLPKNNASNYGVFPSYYPTSILEGEDNNSTQYLGWGKNDRGKWDFVPTTLSDPASEPINILQNIIDESVQLATASFKDEIKTIIKQEISFDLQPQQLYVLLINKANLNRTFPCIIQDSNNQPLLTIRATLEATLKVVFYTNNSYPSCKLSILGNREISGIGLYAVNEDNNDMFFKTVEHDETSNIVVLQPSDYEDFVVVPAAFCYKEKNIKCGYQTYNHTCVPIFPFCEVLGYYTVDYKKDPTNLVVIDPVNKDACDAFDKKKGNIKARTRI